MSTAPQAEPLPHVILVATDLSPTAELAIQQAWFLACQRADAELHVVHVIEASETVSSAHEVEARRRTLQELPPRILEHATECAQAAGLPAPAHPVGVHVRYGPAARAIMQLAADLDANLLVVGSHGKSGLQHFFGSVSRKLVQAGRLPVLVSRPKRLEDMREAERLLPPCPDCIEARQSSGGLEWWCDLHGREHVSLRAFSRTHRVDYTKPSADSQGAYLPR